MEAEAERLTVPDLHGGEMSGMSQVHSPDLLETGRTAVDLDLLYLLGNSRCVTCWAYLLGFGQVTFGFTPA